MKRDRMYSPATREAARLLGARVAVARRERRWTAQALVDRMGATRDTVRKVENGDLSVGLGPALEAAHLVGVPLFHPDPERRSVEAKRLNDRLAVLPETVRQPARNDNDF